MKPIETRIEFKSSPRTVFKAIANPANIPRYAPGIRQAKIVANRSDGIGTRIDLTTERERHLEAVVTEEARNRFAAIQDDSGIVNEWELTRTPRGTLATNRILGEFTDERARDLEREARAKVFEFRDYVDAARNP